MELICYELVRWPAMRAMTPPTSTIRMTSIKLLLHSTSNLSICGDIECHWISPAPLSWVGSEAWVTGSLQLQVAYHRNQPSNSVAKTCTRCRSRASWCTSSPSIAKDQFRCLDWPGGTPMIHTLGGQPSSTKIKRNTPTLAITTSYCAWVESSGCFYQIYFFSAELYRKIFSSNVEA